MIKPRIRMKIWLGVKASGVLMRSRPVAKVMVGRARRKEYSTAVERSRPRRRPPMMVEAERETPGIMARDWKIPRAMAWG